MEAAAVGGLLYVTHPAMCLTFVTPRTVARQAPLSTGLSRQDSWSGWPFPPPGDHVCSELFTMTRLSWVALHSVAHHFTEFCKPLHQDKAVTHEGRSEDRDRKRWSKRRKQANRKCLPSRAFLLCESSVLRLFELFGLCPGPCWLLPLACASHFSLLTAEFRLQEQGHCLFSAPAPISRRACGFW